MDTECLFVDDYRQSRNFYSFINETMYDVLNGREIKLHKFYYYYRDDRGNTIYYDGPYSEKNMPKEFSSAYYSKELDDWVYLTFSGKSVDTREEIWEANKVKLNEIVYRGITFAILGGILLVYLIGAAGKKALDNGVHLIKLDYANSELLLLIFGISVSLLGFLIYKLLNSISPFTDFNEEYQTTIYTDITSKIFLRMHVICAVVAILTAISAIFLLSLVRKIKAGNLVKKSILYKLAGKFLRVCYDLYKILAEKRLFRGYPRIKVLQYRQQIFIASSTLIVGVGFLFTIYQKPAVLIPILLEPLIVIWYTRGNRLLYEEINKDYQESLEEQMKAERMKVALITNVSHDLKTPLTSIVSYLDLLSKEEELQATAKDYVRILQDKSDRLKNMVTDLFDLAKSTSGDIELELETIDMKKLIEQTLADMEDRIEASEIKIKTNLPDKSVNIRADGKKLYRVLQNIIDNALKYSMMGTRVFIDLSINKEEVVMVIKNTSGYEMNFTPEEVLQRFTRGDKSRTTEGSGLGLSIAESFTKNLGGSFSVNIDGDLFKVALSFPI
jgi:signal transduction histidine kinase